jgi:hypothetical protein
MSRSEDHLPPVIPEADALAEAIRDPIADSTKLGGTDSFPVLRRSDGEIQVLRALHRKGGDADEIASIIE